MQFDTLLIFIFVFFFLLIFCSFVSFSFSFLFTFQLGNSFHSTYSAKTLRRSIIIVGLVTLGLLIFETGWEATKAVNSKKDPNITIISLAIEDILPVNGDIWYDALVQVLLSTNIAIGVLPVITGKFIYKGDAVRYGNMTIYFFFPLMLRSHYDQLSWPHEKKKRN